MRVAVHQPQYLPWLGFFDKADCVDCFVILDNVQYHKNEWQNRNRIKSSNGTPWLTVPVHYRFPQRICDVQVDDESGWRQKHWRSISQSYRKCADFDLLAVALEPLYTTSWRWLVDLNLAGIERLAQALNIAWSPRLTSEMDLAEEPTQRLIDICRQVGADHYLAGSGSAGYLDARLFQEAGIAVEFQEFVHPVYPQLYGAFKPALSIVDLLFNCGSESLERLRSSRQASGSSRGRQPPDRD